MCYVAKLRWDVARGLPEEIEVIEECRRLPLGGKFEPGVGFPVRLPFRRRVHPTAGFVVLLILPPDAPPDSASSTDS
jgi:hypothetical protein